MSAWGLSGVVAKNIDMSGVAIGAYRFLMYALIVGTIMAMRSSPITLRALRVALPGGLALGADVAFFFSAVKETTVANATVIGALQPIIVAAVAWRFFGERMAKRDIALAGIAIAGVFAVVLAARDTDGWSLRGDLLAVGALVSWSAYFVFAKQSKGKISSNEYTIGAAFWTGLVNIPIALVFGQSLAWPSATNWLWLLVLALGAGVLGHEAMNWSLRQIPLWLGSTMTLFVPLVSAAAAWIFLGERITAFQALAMAVVLGALAAVIVGQSGVGSRPRPLRR